MNSVNTNRGATIALQSLNRTNRELDMIQKRISTGFRVADAKDDGASFAVAQGLRADVKGNEAVSERLSVAKGLLAVTGETLRSMSDSLGDLRKLVTKMADDAISSDEWDSYVADGMALANNMFARVQQASFLGINLLNDTAAVQVIADADGGTIALPAVDIEAALGIFASVTVNAPADLRIMIAPGGSLDVLQKTIHDQLAAIGAASRRVDNQGHFIQVLADTIHDAIGSIVDADLAKESARLQAMQIRQQLGTQTLAIANQSPMMVVNLFSGIR